MATLAQLKCKANPYEIPNHLRCQKKGGWMESNVCPNHT